MRRFNHLRRIRSRFMMLGYHAGADRSRGSFGQFRAAISMHDEVARMQVGDGAEVLQQDSIDTSRMSVDVEVDQDIMAAVHRRGMTGQPAAEIGRIEGMIIQADLVQSRDEIRNGIATRPGREHEGIVAGTAAHDVVAGATYQQVVAGSAVQRVVAGVAEQQVLAVAAIDGVARSIAGDNIVAGRAVSAGPAVIGQRIEIAAKVVAGIARATVEPRSEEHTSELQSRQYLVCRLLLEKKKKKKHKKQTKNNTTASY